MANPRCKPLACCRALPAPGRILTWRRTSQPGHPVPNVRVAFRGSVVGFGRVERRLNGSQQGYTPAHNR